jgi:hypothetical protein
VASADIGPWNVIMTNSLADTLAQSLSKAPLQRGSVFGPCHQDTAEVRVLQSVYRLHQSQLLLYNRMLHPRPTFMARIESEERGFPIRICLKENSSARDIEAEGTGVPEPAVLPNHFNRLI